MTAVLLAVALVPVGATAALRLADRSAGAPSVRLAAEGLPTPAAVADGVADGVVTPSVVLAADVSPLTHLQVPDLAVVGSRTLPDETVAAVRALPGVTAVEVFAAGRVRLGSTATTVIGVDASTFRAFTPAPTASSDALWASVGAGELLLEPGTARTLRLQLGTTVPVATSQLRLGSLAGLRIPGVEGLVDGALSARLGLVPAAGLLVAGDGSDPAALARKVTALVGTGTSGATTSDVAPSLGQPGQLLTEPLYRAAAATCAGLPWTVLAAIGTVESGNGASTAVSSAGAVGPMQFLPATFAQYATDGDGDGRADITDGADAVFSAAKMLCADGSPADGWRSAVFAYNHAQWYVDAVLTLSQRYGGPAA